MPWLELIWEWDEEDGNVAHWLEHGVSPEDVEEVFEHSMRHEKSRSSGRPLCSATPAMVAGLPWCMSHSTIRPSTP